VKGWTDSEPTPAEPEKIEKVDDFVEVKPKEKGIFRKPNQVQEAKAPNIVLEEFPVFGEAPKPKPESQQTSVPQQTNSTSTGPKKIPEREERRPGT